MEFRKLTGLKLSQIYSYGKQWDYIEAALANIPYEEKVIRKAVSLFNTSTYFSKLTVDEFVRGLF